MFRVIEVCLVERPTLAFIDRAGIAVPEVFKRLGVEGEQGAVAPVETHGNLVPVNALNDAGVAIKDREPLLGAGKLNSVACCKVMATVFGLEAVREAELSPRLTHPPQFAVQRIHIGIRVREYEAGFSGISCTVRGPLLHQRGTRLVR